MRIYENVQTLSETNVLSVPSKRLITKLALALLSISIGSIGRIGSIGSMGSIGRSKMTVASEVS